MNGGKNIVKKQAVDYEDFRDTEIESIYDKIIKLHKDLYKEHKIKKKEQGKSNIKGSFVGKVIRDIENKILQKMYEYFGNPENAVLCFDGLMLKMNSINQTALDKCEEYVYDELHINITLAEKPFENKFDMSNHKEIPKYEEMKLEQYNDKDKLVDEYIELEVAEEWLNNSIYFLENNAKLRYLIRSKEIDIDSKEVLLKYEYRTPIEIEDSLNKVPMYVINPKYDYKLAQECKDDKKLYATLTKEEQISTKKYLYTTFVNKNDGLIDIYKIHRKKDSKRYPTKSFTKTEYYPFLKRKGEPNMQGAFNLFTGYPLEDVELKEKINFEKSKIFKHMRDILCDGNIDEFNHLLDFIADLIQDGANHKSNAHIFYSKFQGVGKGLLIEFLTLLLGKNNVVIYDNTELYFENFNSEASGKILIVLEEVKDKGVAHANHNIIKSNIAAKLKRIVRKYHEAVFERNCARLISNTNNENALNIEPTDRRFTCHSANCSIADNLEYFLPIVDEIKNEQFCKNAFEYFATRIYKCSHVRMAFQNYFKIQQKLRDSPYGIRFIKDLLEDKIMPKPQINILSDLNMNLITRITLFRAAKDWCDNNGCKNFYSEAKIRDHLKLIGLEEISINYKNGSFKGAKQWCYNLNKDEILKGFKKFLKIDENNKEFKFDMEKDITNEQKNINLEFKDESDNKYNDENDIPLADDSDDTDNDKDSDDADEDSEIDKPEPEAIAMNKKYTLDLTKPPRRSKSV